MLGDIYYCLVVLINSHTFAAIDSFHVCLSKKKNDIFNYSIGAAGELCTAI